MEAQEAAMKQELLRIIKMPLFGLIIGAGTVIRLIFACFDHLYRENLFWSLSASSWGKIGAFTMAALILAVFARLFSLDNEYGTQDVISSTVFGRQRLFWHRQFAATTGVIIGVMTLSTANVLISVSLGQRLIWESEWIMNFLVHTGIALCGCIGLSVVAGAICDISKSQPVTLCICGIPFLISIFVNADMVQPFELFWFFRYGFFTELMRGETPPSMLGFWIIWYGIMLILVLMIAIHKRKERKEL
ncbi:MAG: hypothetical protein GXY01_07645 [Clostridiales bacterium]|jgi:hypothetical protein|nr:hypothetical protein [Clostridiales bacterium]